MTVPEMVLAIACILIVGSSWWWAMTRPAFSEWMAAMAERHSKGTEDAIAQAFIEGYEAGQEYEQLRGSRPTP